MRQNRIAPLITANRLAHSKNDSTSAQKKDMRNVKCPVCICKRTDDKDGKTTNGYTFDVVIYRKGKHWVINELPNAKEENQRSNIKN